MPQPAKQSLFPAPYEVPYTVLISSVIAWIMTKRQAC
jgi:hypothetical protein